VEGHRGGLASPGGMAQPYGPPGRRSCGLRFGCRTVGEHGAAWVIRHVLVNHACVPKSHPAIGETALGAPTKRPRSIEAGHNPGDVSACLRGHGPGRAVTPAHRWGRDPPGWLDGDSPRQSPSNPSTPATRRCDRQTGERPRPRGGPTAEGVRTPWHLATERALMGRQALRRRAAPGQAGRGWRPAGRPHSSHGRCRSRA